MVALPAGLESSVGAYAVDASVRQLQRIPDLDAVALAARERQLQAYADTLTQHCDPARNPSSYRVCQASGRPAVDGLLLLAHAAKRSEARASAAQALARLAFGCRENAAEVLCAGGLDAVFAKALRPIEKFQQQEEQLCAMLLLQALAAAAPEAPMLAQPLASVAAVIFGEFDGLPPCVPVRVAGIEVLVSCTMSQQHRKQVANLLPAPRLARFMAEVQVPESLGPAGPFSLGLLLANIADLAGASGDDLAAGASLGFGELAGDFWRRTGFFDALAGCLQASLAAEQFPPQSGIYHMPWKLASTMLRLASAGYGRELAASLPLLRDLAAVGTRDAAEDLGADEARAGRLAADALHAAAAAAEEASDVAEHTEGPVYVHDLLVAAPLERLGQPVAV